MSTDSQSLPDVFGEVTQADPYPTYDKLRSECPVFFNEATGTYALTAHKDIQRVLRDPQTFANGHGAITGEDTGEVDLRTLIMAGDDDPRHQYLRQLFANAFSPRQIQEFRPNIRRIVEGLANNVPEGEAFDATKVLAVPLPMLAVSEFMGIPESDVMIVVNAADQMTGSGYFTEPNPVEGEETFRAYFREAIQERIGAPRDDILSIMAEALANPTTEYSDEDSLRTCFTFMSAGMETTKNQITNLLAALSDRPETWATLREHPEMVTGAVEEALRYDGPVHQIIKRATTDVEIAGVELPAGSFVSLALAAANRDQSTYENPAEFVLGRPNLKHLAFGRGVHFCIGAPLARLEMVALLEILVERFARIEPAGDRVLLAFNGRVRGYGHLPLRMYTDAS